MSSIFTKYDFSSPEAINCQYLLSQYGTSRAPPALMIEFLLESKLFKPSTGNHIHLEGVNGMSISCEKDSIYSPLFCFLRNNLDSIFYDIL